MVVIRCTKGRSYILGELDSTLSKLRFTAFRIMSYQLRNIKAIPVTKLLEIPDEELEKLTHDSGNSQDVEDEEEL